MNKPARVRPIDLAALIPLDSNPQIDLKLHAYEASTRNFLKAVANYTSRATTEITNRRNAQVEERKRLAERIQAVETETNQCKVREIELIATLEAEQNEKREAELSVAALKRQLASLRKQIGSVDVEIEQYRALTANLRQEKDKERLTLETYAARVSPELHACERNLRCMVEGIEKDRLLVRFAQVDPADPDREFSLVLDVSSRSYKVLTSTPLLPTLPILLDALNESRDIYGFIKEARRAFSDLVIH
ncbi:hypothetical protein PLICRDRAFT_122327 [Plicaturopsis crispa FD-325 SS-3]|nr:hypothetical protein PLICRDRAFT_122327 [Plicaturopsis crispa FD-325 SS-3]